ncbi:hypothetical protein FRC07_014634 [Ceratobasidium sp. 392]|nr:hypothetical protein FRC07_014634 [Ceratobasidium sp. 392]
MSFTTNAMQLAATTFNAASSVLGLELTYQLLEYLFLFFILRSSSCFTAKSTIPPVVLAPVPKRLPMLIRYMSHPRKSMLRATYARDFALFRPGSAQLPLAQRFLAAPITLSGPDGSVNVALRPLAAQVPLGHEFSPEPTPCSTPRISMYMNSQAEVRATLQGATAVLEALVSGVANEEWLNEPSVESKPVEAPLMSRSFGQEGRSYSQLLGLEGTKTRMTYGKSNDSESCGMRTPSNSKDTRIAMARKEKK